MATNSRNVMPPPFSLIYTGFGRFIVHKGFVFQANNGNKINVTYNGELLQHGWKEAGTVIELQSGDTLSIKITHGDKESFRKYEIVDLESAELVIGEPDTFASNTVTAIKVADVEYDDGVSDPLVNQILNSDVYLAIFGENSGLD